MTYETRAGVKIFHKTTGDGTPAIFSHCSLGNHNIWRPLVDRMSDGWRCTAIDLPDHARSDATPVGQDPQRLAADVLLDLASDHEEPVHLVGHSFGGTAALLAAVTQPEMFGSLTLLEPVPFGIAKGTKAYDDHSAALADFPAALAAGNKRKAAEIFHAVWGGGVKLSHLQEGHMIAIIENIQVIGRQGPALYDDINGIMRPGGLAQITCPVRLVGADRSPSIAAVMLDVLHQHMPHAVRHTIADAGHMFPQTHPSQVADILQTL